VQAQQALQRLRERYASKMNARPDAKAFAEVRFKKQETARN
jgi:hypothetical protein